MIDSKLYITPVLSFCGFSTTLLSVKSTIPTTILKIKLIKVIITKITNLFLLFSPTQLSIQLQ